MRLLRLSLLSVNLLRCIGLCSSISTRSNPKFLIVSAPQHGKVSYAKLDGKGEVPAEMSVLIETGLVHPQGIAVDAMRKRLFVAEPQARKVFAYNLTRRGDQLTVGPQEVAAEGTEARWVATDAFGNLLFTDEPANQVMRVSAERLREGHHTAEAMFSGSSLMEVSAPGGIATDGINTMWVNKALGTHVGSVVSALESPAHTKASNARALSSNVDKSYGICMAMNNVFYTQPDKSIYAVKRRGGEPTLISDKLAHPRGCVWDGQNTVYVADRGNNAVFSFPGTTSSLSAMQLSVAAHADDAFGVAIFSGAHRYAVASLLALWTVWMLL